MLISSKSIFINLFSQKFTQFNCINTRVHCLYNKVFLSPSCDLFYIITIFDSNVVHIHYIVNILGRQFFFLAAFMQFPGRLPFEVNLSHLVSYFLQREYMELIRLTVGYQQPFSPHSCLLSDVDKPTIWFGSKH